MNIEVDTIIGMLNRAILEKDIIKTLMLTMQLKESVAKDPKAVKWVVDPTNLKELHTKLTENLDIPQKMMMIKNRIPHRQKRAFLFVQAIENGIRKVMDEQMV